MIRLASTAPWMRCVLLALTACLPAMGQSRAPSPDPIAVTSVRLAGSADEAPLKTLLLQNGRIEAVLPEGQEIPGSYRVIDGTGLTAAPAFVDAYTHGGVEAPEIVAQKDRPISTAAGILTDMREANRKGVQASFRAADGLALSDEQAEALRKSGFGAMLAAPHGQLIAGHSSIVLARNAAARDQVLRPVVFQHASFRSSGGGYPSTLMGHMAAFRQLMMDAQRHGELMARSAKGQPGPRPPYDRDLEELAPVLAGDQVLMCAAESDRDVRRWIRLSEEFGFKLAIAGGRDAWQAADRLVKHKVPVMLTLNWGDEVKAPKEEKDDHDHEEGDEGEPEDHDEDEETGHEEPDAEQQEAADAEEVEDHDETEEAPEPFDFDYSEPMAVQQQRRSDWVQRRDGAQRLADAGVRIAFGSGGDSGKDLLKNVRTLVKEGFSPERALAGLTSGAAELLGVGDELGSIKPGFSATLCLWTGDPLESGSQVRWAIVDGFDYEYEVKEKAADGEGPGEGVDLSGTWTVEDPDEEDDSPMVLTLKMDEAGELTGSAKATNPMDGSELSSDVKGSVSGDSFEIKLTFAVGGMEVDMELTGKLKKDSIKGKQVLRFGGQEQESKFEGEKEPGRARQSELQR